MESRYRTIHCKMWGDEWFLALTQPQPCGAWLYRESYYNPKADRTFEVAVAKNRNGPTGIARIYFEQDTGYFADLERDDDRQEDLARYGEKE